jgi:hypothetical protein
VLGPPPVHPVRNHASTHRWGGARRSHFPSELAARGDIWPLVTEKCPFDAKEVLTVHSLFEALSASNREMFSAARS